MTTDHITGTPDGHHDLLWYTQTRLDNVLRLDSCLKHAQEAGDTEAAELFAKAQQHSRKGAEIGKRLLASRLAPLTGDRTEPHPDAPPSGVPGTGTGTGEVYAPDVRGESPPEPDPSDAPLPQDPQKP
ncbi:hypothetical protein ACIA8O_36205 [Kitasatospora sp. NPDC051853]|uniref:hypothetical protein n=1 Tax=Kitasatospora sp. NPDC051853 TaxID=3364058 RepID=UPI0037A59CAD